MKNFSRLAVALVSGLAVVWSVVAATVGLDEFGAKEGLFGVDVRANTEAVAAAIASCAAKGGGEVVVPAGRWRVGAIRLRSGVYLNLAKDSFLIFEDDPAFYRPVVKTSWEGMECLNLSPLVYACDAERTGIVGEGTLAPRMAKWREWFVGGKIHRSLWRGLYEMMGDGEPIGNRNIDGRGGYFRPPLLEFNRCRNVVLKGVRIRESPFWTMHFLKCDGVEIRGIDSRALGHNSDGVNLEKCRNVTVADCTLWQGDDGVVIKAGRNRDGWHPDDVSENIDIRNVFLREGHGLLVVGSEMSGGVRNVTMRDSRQTGAAFSLFQLKCNRRRGGFVENVRMSGCSADTVRHAIDIQTDSSEARDCPMREEKLTKISNLTFDHCSVGTAGRILRIRGERRLPVKGLIVDSLSVGLAGSTALETEARDAVTVTNLSVGAVDPIRAAWTWDVPKPWYAVYDVPSEFADAARLAAHGDFGDFRLRFAARPAGAAPRLSIRGKASVSLAPAAFGDAGADELKALYRAYDATADWQRVEVIVHRRAISVSVNGFEVVCNRRFGADFPEKGPLAFADVETKDIVLEPIVDQLYDVPSELLELARRDGATLPIVIGRACDPAVLYAAEELRDYAKKITGTEMPIVRDGGTLPDRAVILGKTRFTSSLLPPAPRLKDDGFRLYAADGRLVIDADIPRGVLYGVYEILERFAGCAWYASWCARIPAAERLAVPAALDERHEPSFAMREPFWYDVLQNPAFATRLRANSRTFSGKPGEPAHEARFGNGDFRFNGTLSIAHTFFKLLPPEKYFAAHPEYYSLIDGRRRNDGQLCLSNPDVLRLVTARVLEEIRRDPHARFYGISQNDNTNYCRCEKCAAADAEEDSHAGALVRFLNRIGEVVEREYPDVKLETLAYTFSRRPPKKTKLRANVVPCLCSIECDFSRPLPESPFAENVTFADDIAGWSRQTENLLVWDYTTDFFHYPMTFANVRSLVGNLRFFRANGVRYVFEQGAYQGLHGDFAELKAWLLAKAMWNADCDEAALLNDFFAGYYGNAARLVRRYFDEADALERTWCAADAKRSLQIYDGPENPAYSDEDLKRWEGLLEEAERAVRGDAVQSYNVRMSAIGILYSRLQRLRDRFDRRYSLAGAEARRAALPEMKRLAIALGDRLREARGPVAFDERRTLDAAFRAARERLERTGVSDVPADCSRLVVPAAGLYADGPNGSCVLTNDAVAADGKTVRIDLSEPMASVSLPFNWVSFDPGRKIRVRLRLRLGKRGGGALCVGVRDYAHWNDDADHGAPVCERRLTEGEIGEDYGWLEVGTVDPKDTYYVFVQPLRTDVGGNVAEVRIESVELSDAAKRCKSLL